jgi:DNA-binding CsgD family transcriptional regulator
MSTLESLIAELPAQREEVFRKAMAIVEKQAKTVQRNYPQLNVDDLVDRGQLRLVLAVDRLIREPHPNPVAFLTKCVKKVMWREAKKLARLSLLGEADLDVPDRPIFDAGTIKAVSEDIQLSPIEEEILRLKVEGNSVRKIVEATGLSTYNVRRLLEDLERISEKIYNFQPTTAKCKISRCNYSGEECAEKEGKMFDQFLNACCVTAPGGSTGVKALVTEFRRFAPGTERRWSRGRIVSALNERGYRTVEDRRRVLVIVGLTLKSPLKIEDGRLAS